MSFQLEIARLDDAPRITEIHMDAFGSNAIIRAIHAANDKDLKALRMAVQEKLVADIKDSRITVLVVREVNSSVAKGERNAPKPTSRDERAGGVDVRKIVAFAKWIHPYYPQDNYAPPLWSTPNSANWEVLRPWLDEVTTVEQEIVGDTPRYELTYLAVDAEYARRGIGKTLVRWALDKCDVEGYPAYVESTVEAVAFYEKLGFKVAGRISMNISNVNGDTKMELYEEIGCIYSPKIDATTRISSEKSAPRPEQHSTRSM